MNKNKGFTLIELLTVIVVLAIIALITVPIVNGITRRAEKSAFRQSAVGILNTIKLDRSNSGYIAKEENDKYEIKDKKIYFEEEPIKTKHTGEITGVGDVYVNKDGSMAIAYTNNKWCAYKSYANTTVKIISGNCENVITKTCKEPVYEIEDEEIWTQQKQIKSIEAASGEDCTIYYKDENEQWVRFEKSIIYKQNKLYLKLLGTLNEETKYEKDLKIDRTKPDSIEVEAQSTTPNTITVNVIGTDNESGISKYAYSSDNGATWSKWVDEDVYIFENIEPGAYRIKAKVYNGTYGTSGARDSLGVLESEATLVTTTTCSVPKIEVDQTGWAQSKVVTIDYRSTTGCVGSYSIDNGVTWNEGTSVTISENNVKVLARNVVGDNETKSELLIDKIDRSKPTNVTYTTKTTPTSITVNVIGTDEESGIERYAYSIDGGNTWTAWRAENSYTFNNLTPETEYTIKVKVYNGTYNGKYETIKYETNTYSVDKNVQNNTIYKYRMLITTDETTWSSASNEKKLVPAETNRISLVGVGGNKRVTLGWNNVTGVETYRIQKLIDGIYKTVATTEGTTYVDTDVTNNTEYTYRVLSQDAKVKSVELKIKPTENQELGIEGINGDKQVTLIWGNITGVKKYRIQRVKAGSQSNDEMGVLESNETRVVKTTSCLAPEITVEPAGDVWRTQKTVTITYKEAECKVRKYSIDGGTTWKETSNDIVEKTITKNNTTVIGYAGVSETKGESATLKVTKIDNTTPVVNIIANKKSAGDEVKSNTWSNETLTYTFTKTTGDSGATIYYCKDKANSCEPTTKVTNTVSMPDTGIYYIRYKAVSGAGKTSTVDTYTAKVDTTKPTAVITVKNSSGNIVTDGKIVDQTDTYTVTIGCSVGSSGVKSSSSNVKVGTDIKKENTGTTNTNTFDLTYSDVSYVCPDKCNEIASNAGNSCANNCTENCGVVCSNTALTAYRNSCKPECEAANTNGGIYNCALYGGTVINKIPVVITANCTNNANITGSDTTFELTFQDDTTIEDITADDSSDDYCTCYTSYLALNTCEWYRKCSCTTPSGRKINKTCKNSGSSGSIGNLTCIYRC